MLNNEIKLYNQYEQTVLNLIKRAFDSVNELDNKSATSLANTVINMVDNVNARTFYSEDFINYVYSKLTEIFEKTGDYDRATLYSSPNLEYIPKKRIR